MNQPYPETGQQRVENSESIQEARDNLRASVQQFEIALRGSQLLEKGILLVPFLVYGCIYRELDHLTIPGNEQQLAAFVISLVTVVYVLTVSAKQWRHELGMSLAKDSLQQLKTSLEKYLYEVIWNSIEPQYGSLCWKKVNSLMNRVNRYTRNSPVLLAKICGDIVELDSNHKVDAAQALSEFFYNLEGSN